MERSKPPILAVILQIFLQAFSMDEFLDLHT